MSWNLIDRPKTQKVTKALAKSFAEMNPAPHDRPMSERRLMVYQRLLAAGQFRPVTWASALCKETGDVYRVNGKHTSVMLSGLDKIPEFFVTVEEYECETLEDVAKLYATFDSAMQSRSARDIYLSFAATVPALAGALHKVLVIVPTAISYSKLGSDAYIKCTAPERAENLLDHPDFALWLSGLIQGGPTSAGTHSKQKSAHLLRMPVVAAMFASYMRSMKAATEFWVAVRDESGASPNNPDRKLGRYLLTANMQARFRRVQLAKAATSSREVYVKCLHAWNAWRKNETTNLNYYAESKVPAAI